MAASRNTNGLNRRLNLVLPKNQIANRAEVAPNPPANLRLRWNLSRLHGAGTRSDRPRARAVVRSSARAGNRRTANKNPVICGGVQSGRREPGGPSVELLEIRRGCALRPRAARAAHSRGP